MTVTVVEPDTLGDVRTWLRALPDLNAYLAAAGQTTNRVFFATPANVAFPLVRLTDAGWHLTQETPVGTQRLLIEVIGGVPADYYAVSQAKRIITSAVWALRGPIGTTTFVHDGAVDTTVDAPDPDTGAPRKVISAVLTVRVQ